MKSLLSSFLVLLVAVGSTNCKKEDEQQLSYIQLKEITVTRFPADNNGTPWDANDNPDITVKIAKDGHVVWSSLTFLSDVAVGNEHRFSIQPAYSFYAFNDQHTIQLFEVDGPNDETLMGQESFIPNAGSETIIVDNGGDVAFRISVQQVFE